LAKARIHDGLHGIREGFVTLEPIVILGVLEFNAAEEIARIRECRDPFSVL